MSHSTKLTLDDIADQRAYERERASFRAEVIALKKARRVAVGPFVTFVFENRDTVRFQIQEMARVEHLDTDAAIEAELRAYNPLIPEPGHLSATIFIELTEPSALEEWLPKLVGIEQAPRLEIANGGAPVTVRATVDPDHQRALTRPATTSSVHYVSWALPAGVIEGFAAGAVTLVVDHPAYRHASPLRPDTVASLLTDLRGPAA